jgi:hypothetical protein
VTQIKPTFGLQILEVSNLMMSTGSFDQQKNFSPRTSLAGCLHSLPFRFSWEGDGSEQWRKGSSAAYHS